MSMGLFARLARHFVPRSAVSRREFLRTSLSVSAGLLLSGAGLPARRGGGPRVAIIGAGFAGLSCAFELHHAGATVEVFEARRRVGGRVVSVGDWAEAGVVEGGGELVGLQHAVWGTYAARFGLTLEPVDTNLVLPVCLLNGKPLGQIAAAELYEEMAVALGHITADATPIDAEAPWSSPAAAQLDARTLRAVLTSAKTSPTCAAALKAEFEGTNGVPLAAQSYLGLLAAVKGGGLARYWTDSDALRCRGGNQQLAAGLAGPLGERLRLGTPIVRVEILDKGVKLHDESGKVSLCDAIVVAVPPSVWGKIAGLPKVSPPQMGPVVKDVVNLGAWRGDMRPRGSSAGPISSVWTAAAGKHVALACFSGGPAADACRAVPPAKRSAFYAAQLEAMFSGSNMVVRDNKFFDWPAESWTGAGYACPAPGEVTRLGPSLQRTYGALDFAGEHCSYAFVGYMEGALRSGTSVARRVARRLGLAA